MRVSKSAREMAKQLIEHTNKKGPHLLIHTCTEAATRKQIRTLAQAIQQVVEIEFKKRTEKDGNHG